MKAQKRAPIISIITPCYNLTERGGVEFFLKYVESLKCQTFTNFEIIFANDGSSDSTSQIIKNASKGFDNCVTLDLPHNGVSAARNAGLAASKGEYVCFADADDSLSPFFLEILYETICNTKADISVCDFRPVKVNFNLSKRQTKPKANVTTYKNPEDAICQLCLMTNKPFTGSVNKIYKLETLKKIKNFPNVFDTSISYSEDYLFCFHAFDKATKITYFHAPLYFYRQNNNGTIRRPFNLGKLTGLMAADKVISACENKYPEAFEYAKASKGFSSYYMLLGMFKSKFSDLDIIQHTLASLKQNYKYVYKCKRQPLHRKIFWRFAYLFAKMLFYTRLKNKKTI